MINGSVHSTREAIMTRAKTKNLHDPECRIDHDPEDFTCDEAELLRADEVRQAWRECSLAPSRTEPFHVFTGFDFGGDTECVRGCGVTWEQVQDRDADA